MRRDQPIREPAPATQEADRVRRAIERFQAGIEREKEFAYLYKRFFHAIERFFARKGIPAADCLDLTQETFLGLYNGLDGYRAEARFETWLYRIATTVYLKRLRAAATGKRSGQEVPHEDEIASDPALKAPATQLEDVLDEEKRRAMRAAVGRLPEQMRKCLTLRLYHQLKYREIATVMKLKIDTVKVHLFQARKRLAEDLKEHALDNLDLDGDQA